MRWIRVTIPDTSRMVVPDVCPNCLASPANVPTPLVRSTGVPFFASVTTKGKWPFCEHCSKWITRHRRWQTLFGLGPAVVLVALAAVIGYMTSSHRVHPSAYWLLLAAVVVDIIGNAIPIAIQRAAPVPPNCLSNFPTVSPIRGGRAMLSGKNFAILDFAHPLYVGRLVELNSPDIVKVNERQWDRAIASFELRQAAKKKTST